LEKGAYNLNGGTLSTTGVSGYYYAPLPSTFNFNGGILQATQGDPPSGFGFMSLIGTVHVQAGGANIDSDGFNITIAQNLLHDASTGTTDGGLTKLGSGSLTLSGTNTYNGGTTINAGTLIANHDGALGTGNVSLASGSGIQLTLQNGATNNYIADNASLSFNFTNRNGINLNYTGVPDQVAALIINGVYVTAPGTYGALGSGAMYEFPEFTGTGELLIVPEPSTWVLLMGGLAVLIALRRRVCRR